MLDMRVSWACSHWLEIYDPEFCREMVELVAPSWGSYPAHMNMAHMDNIVCLNQTLVHNMARQQFQLTHNVWIPKTMKDIYGYEGFRTIPTHIQTDSRDDIDGTHQTIILRLAACDTEIVLMNGFMLTDQVAMVFEDNPRTQFVSLQDSSIPIGASAISCRNFATARFSEAKSMLF